MRLQIDPGLKRLSITYGLITAITSYAICFGPSSWTAAALIFLIWGGSSALASARIVQLAWNKARELEDKHYYRIPVEEKVQ